MDETTGYVAACIDRGLAFAVGGERGRTVTFGVSARVVADLRERCRAGDEAAVRRTAAAYLARLAADLGVMGRYRELVRWLVDHPDPAVRARLLAMLPQVPPRGPIGLLRFRAVPARPGRCLACGAALPAATPGAAAPRCRPCRIATGLAIRRVREGAPD